MEPRPTILLVDDISEDIKILVDILRIDYHIVMANSGLDACATAVQTQPDLILLGIVMLGMDGYQVCEELKNQDVTKTIPIIFVTSREDPWDEVRALQLGAVDFITKPVRPAIALARIKTQLELKRQKDAIQALASRLKHRVRQEVEKSRNAEIRFKMLVETMRDGLGVFDREQRLIFVNDRFCEMVGDHREALLGKTAQDILTRAYPSVLLHTCQANPVNEPDDYETTFANKNREKTHVIVSPRLIYDKQGLLNGSFATITDITKRRNAEDALRRAHTQLAKVNEILHQRIKDHKKTEAEKLALQEQAFRTAQLASLGEMFAHVSHEINNPNMAIGFNAGMLVSAWQDVAAILREYRKDNGNVDIGGLPISQAIERYPLLAREIQKNSVRIKEIIINLKKMARPDIGEDGVVVDVREILQSVVSILGGQVKQYTEHFTLKMPRFSVTVTGNVQQLEQVFLNVLLNALQALPNRQRKVWVLLSCNEENQEALVEIEDEGVGIPEENIKWITNPFVSTKFKSGGTGLGLSITATILEAHKGSITFDSVVDVGTRVTMRLPLTARGKSTSPS